MGCVKNVLGCGGVRGEVWGCRRRQGGDVGV